MFPFRLNKKSPTDLYYGTCLASRFRIPRFCEGSGAISLGSTPTPSIFFVRLRISWL